jgi:penicillin-binding protein 1B
MALRDRIPIRPQGRHLRWALLLLLVLPPFVMGVEALVRARLHELTFADAATRVYARPLTLERGVRADRDAVEDHLRRLGYRRTRGREVGIGEYYLGSRGWIIGKRPSRALGSRVPASFAVVRFDYSGRISRMEDEEGRSLSQVSLEPELMGRLPGGATEDRIPVQLQDVPDALITAVLTVEDQRFFDHAGLDYRRIAAAFVANLKAGEVVQGGSTLTQQLAKNLYLSPRRSLVRKVREAMMALTLEGRHSKEEILEAYLNHVYLGQDGSVGIHGVGRAAQYFFGKDVSTLDLAESALLVALIRAPSAYSPYRNPKTALERRNLVLRLMNEAGVISEDEAASAREEPLTLRDPPDPVRSARYFLDYLASQLPEGVTGEALVTTLDLRLQRAAEEAVRDGLRRLERDFDWLREGEAGEPLQAALVAMDPRTGEILAMVGGRDYGSSQFNRAVNARRQPGSAFKPVVALAALARDRRDQEGAATSVRGPGGSGREERWRRDGDGEPGGPAPAFTLASILEDEPFQVETPVGLWQPANYDGSFHGTVTLRDALERSLNVPFARLGMALGPERIVETAHAMGIESSLNPYPSIALGASEVSPLELTRAFGVLAADGYRPELTSLLWRVEDGQAVPASIGSSPPSSGSSSASLGNARGSRQVFDAAETYLVTSALRGAVERGTGRGLRDRGYYGEVAAKSGTTNDFRDGWFMGYTPSLVVGVWVGFDHGKRLELPGAGVALPIFTDFLTEAVGPSGRSGSWGSEGFPLPSGLEMVDVDPTTGLRGGWGCRGEPEVFLSGTAPEESCSGFRLDGRIFRVLTERGSDEISRLLRRLFEGEPERTDRRRGGRERR